MKFHLWVPLISVLFKMSETVCLFGLYGRLIIPLPEIYYRYNKIASFLNFFFIFKNNVPTKKIMKVMKRSLNHFRYFVNLTLFTPIRLKFACLNQRNLSYIREFVFVIELELIFPWPV